MINVIVKIAIVMTVIVMKIVVIATIAKNPIKLLHIKRIEYKINLKISILFYFEIF